MYHEISVPRATAIRNGPTDYGMGDETGRARRAAHPGPSSAPMAPSTTYRPGATCTPHDRSGEAKAGWPVSVPGVYPGCGSYGPYLAPDETIYVLGDELAAMSPDGTGWRYRPEGGKRTVLSIGVTAESPKRAAFGPDGTVYIAVFAHDTGSWAVVALDREGRVKRGWPHHGLRRLELSGEDRR